MTYDYNTYLYSRLDIVKQVSIGALIGGMIGYTFYNNMIGVIVLLPYGFLYYKNKKKENIEQQKWKLNLEFRDALQSIATGLSVGYSLENSMKEAVEELKLIYDEKAMIMIELKEMNRKVALNESVDEVLQDFAKRSGLEDIENFSTIIQSTKHTGGDLIKVIKSTTDTIHNRIEVKREILTLVSAKRLEANIMSMIPIGIILYLNLFSANYLEPLYNGIFGTIIMTLILFIYYFAYRMSKKIVDIKL